MLIAEKRKQSTHTGGRIDFDFTSPLEFVADANFYKFEMSNPIVGLDPMGLADSPGQSTTPPVSNGFHQQQPSPRQQPLPLPLRPHNRSPRKAS
jgi:hypothetical protein